MNGILAYVIGELDGAVSKVRAVKDLEGLEAWQREKLDDVVGDIGEIISTIRSR